MLKNALLACGIVSSLLYAAMNILVPLSWEEYKTASQTVSELSAVGAPTRPTWVFFGVIYTALVVAFGCGVRMAAGVNRSLRVAGSMLIAIGIIGLFWPPMHLRGNAFSLIDALHIAFGVATIILMLLTMWFGAAAFGWRFYLYTIVTIVVFLVFGVLTGIDAPKIAAELPTPWIGVWERINIGAFLLWVIVLASALIRVEVAEHPAGSVARIQPGQS
jgi:MFS family permease